jgi:tetratricopeptide (TPR) repeat protein
MPVPNARRALYRTGLAAMALLAFFAAGFATRPAPSQGAATEELASRPTWEQLMGRSVQARKAGAVRDSEALLEEATALVNSFGPNDLRRAHHRLGQAEFHLWSGRPELAEPAYRDAVRIGESIVGGDHPEMISLLEGLANFYYYREQYDYAMPIFMRLLNIVRAARPYDPHEEARRLRNLAQLERLRGRHENATSFHLQALKLVEGSPRASAGEVAEYLQGAAESYLAWGRARLAQPLATRSVALIETLAGPESLDVVPHLKTLAQATMDSGDPARAAKLHERAIAIVERVSGPAHSDLAPHLLGLATALRSLDRMREAELHAARAARVTRGPADSGPPTGVAGAELR